MSKTVPLFKKYNSRRRREIRAILLERDGNICAWCGASMLLGPEHENHPDSLSVDHIKRQREGGTNSLKNMRLMHRRCNRERG